jgi:hypothetical protein
MAYAIPPLVVTGRTRHQWRTAQSPHMRFKVRVDIGPAL